MYAQVSPRDWVLKAMDANQLLELFQALDSVERLERYFRSMGSSLQNRGFKQFIDAGCVLHDRENH